MQHLWMTLYFAWPVSEVLLVLATRTRHSAGHVQDRGSIYLLWAVIVGSMCMSSWYAIAHPIGRFAGGIVIQTTSLAMLVAGLAIRWTAIFSLGRAFSVNVAIHAGQRLYRRGLFALVRHPSYTGMLLIFAALGLRLDNWISLAIAMVPPLLALLYRMDVEEQALALAFGEEYQIYRRSTKRLIPGLY
jgi:protein-S-isoprenylcysteine O-methyltransferase Ste14